MKIYEMNLSHIQTVLPIYIAYYNGQEDGCWTEATAGKRIHQVLSMEGAYSLILEEHGAVLGFAMGYFKQYDDILGYTLEEILIAKEYQNKGIGTFLLGELERIAKEKGASCMELQAVNDAWHEAYYGKAGYHDAKNFVLKVKWFD